MQAKYALLARGDADIYLRFPPADYNEKAHAGERCLTARGAAGAACPALSHDGTGRLCWLAREIATFDRHLRDLPPYLALRSSADLGPRRRGFHHHGGWREHLGRPGRAAGLRQRPHAEHPRGHPRRAAKGALARSGKTTWGVWCDRFVRWLARVLSRWSFTDLPEKPRPQIHEELVRGVKELGYVRP